MNLMELEAIGTPVQVRPTMAHAQLAKTTDPQHVAMLVAAINGRVDRGGKEGEASIATLNALARKGFMTLTAHAGTRRSNWAYGELTERGWKELKRTAG